MRARRSAIVPVGPPRARVRPALRTAVAVAAAAVLALLAVPVGAQVSGPASTTTSPGAAESSDGGCPERYDQSTNVVAVASGDEIDPEVRLGDLITKNQTLEAQFGQEREPAVDVVYVVATSPLPQHAPAEPVRVEAELTRKGGGVATEAVVPNSTIQGGALALRVCVDPSKLDPGEYEGFVSVADDRLPSASIPISVTVQYPLLNLTWLVYVVGVLVLSFVVVYVIHRAALRRETRSNRGPGLLQFASHNRWAFVIGLFALAGAVLTTYWRDLAWSGRIDDWVDLSIVVLPAVVAAMSGSLLYSDTSMAVARQGAAGLATAGADVADHVPVVPAAPPMAAPAPAPPPADVPPPLHEPAGDALPWPEDPTTPMAVPAPSPPEPDRPMAPSKRRSATTSVVAIAFGLAVVVAIVVASVRLWDRSDASSQSQTASSGSASALVTGGDPDVPVQSTVASGSFVQVPDVYDLPAAEGLEVLQEAGLVPFAYDVCSGSVDRGRIRQVDFEGAPTLNEAVSDAGALVPAGSTVEVKISNGEACNA